MTRSGGFNVFLEVVPPLMFYSFWQLSEKSHFSDCIKNIGGFAYVQQQVNARTDGKQYKYWYFPVIPLETLVFKISPKQWDSPVHIPEYNQFIKSSELDMSKDYEKFTPDVGSMKFGAPKWAGLGLASLLGLTDHHNLDQKYRQDGGVKAVEEEIRKMGIQEDIKNLHYVLTVSTEQYIFVHTCCA